MEITQAPKFIEKQRNKYMGWRDTLE